MRVVQVVRNFSTTGGMEDYVWRLTNSLVAQGVEVKVVCERCDADVPDGVSVSFVSQSLRGPRWFRSHGFSNQLKKWRNRHLRSNDIIHSHEFIGEADLLTFHTTIHGYGERSWLKRMDPSWHFNQWLEKKAVCSSRLKFLIPVSDMLRNQLDDNYRGIKNVLSSAITPGVIRPKCEVRSANDSYPHVLGFIGREWERKGLKLVFEIFRYLVKKNPHLKLVIAGVDFEELKPFVAGLESQLDIMGWVQDKVSFYEKIDILLHPARLEAFGMVVTESLACGIPVLVSDQVGAASEVKEEQGLVLPLKSSISEWGNAANILLKQHSKTSLVYDRSWDQVALEYQELYAKASSVNE